jgi:hypothetical protein
VGCDESQKLLAEKPSFWPSDIPFCLPSATEEIKSGDYESGDYAFIFVENTRTTHTSYIMK